jgi:glycosyltransferase involved in cell wall biosynthesis
MFFMRIIYWNTSCLQPELEAVSKEVFQLARHFRNSLLFGINPHYLFCASVKKKYVGFHPVFDPLLRGLIPFVERSGDINHVYGEPTPWTFYKTLCRKPTVLTIASSKGDPHMDFLEHCRKVWVQTDTSYRDLLTLGVDKRKVEVLYPAVDLSAFRPSGRASGVIGTPRVLFATAPRSAEEMEGRGVYLLLKAAKENPDIRYRFIYRTWKRGYTSLAATAQWIEAEELHNITLTNSVVSDMSRAYREHHFTVIPYTRSDGGKACPTSLVEGLACGIPVLISSVAPFAYFVAEHRCGVVFEPTPSSLVAAVETGMRQYAALSSNALKAARHFFSEAHMLRKVARVYQDIMS